MCAVRWLRCVRVCVTPLRRVTHDLLALELGGHDAAQLRLTKHVDPVAVPAGGPDERGHASAFSRDD